MRIPAIAVVIFVVVAAFAGGIVYDEHKEREFSKDIERTGYCIAQTAVKNDAFVLA